MQYTDQRAYDVRFDWGGNGLAALQECATFIIVDVLSFSTCVSIAVDGGAAVLPFVYDAEAALEFAKQHDAIVAAPRGVGSGYSLSPASLLGIASGTRLVLPSPNGSTLASAAGGMDGGRGRRSVLAGCLRNRSAVARVAAARGGPVAVIAAGERWADGSLRPCVEDLWGAGAIIRALAGSRSPEASAACASFSAAMASGLRELLLGCASGRELVERGFAEDVALAGALDVSTAAAELRDGAFVRATLE
jgi:2-phosphosulfolactate phosphatase